ncbi:hypothetical protein D3C78_1804030 [compost metagenome]
MARMEFVLQRIEHQQIQATKLADRFRRKVTDITAIGEIADAKSERMDIAVKLHQGLEGDRTACPCNDHR